MPNNGEPQTGVNYGSTKPTSSNIPTKRAKTIDSGVDLIGAFEHGTQTLANAIKTTTKIVADNILPDGLFESVDRLDGFELQHKAKYYVHLVANPDSVRVFIDLPFEYKLSWVSTFISMNC
jgi:hypothetical protein